MTTEDHLATIFVYSLVIYPIAGYLVSPSRSYSRTRGAIYAVLFLLSVALAQVIYENIDTGPNFYQVLNLSTDVSSQQIRKAYRALSLELHPDKNPSVTAKEDFRRLKLAHDVLFSKEKRIIYDNFGIEGIRFSEQHAFDLKHIITGMLIYYFSTMLFTFFMTFSEPSGGAMKLSFFGVTVLLLIESCFCIFDVKIGNSLPFLGQITPFQIITFFRRMYPAYMNCVRCVLGAFYVDKRIIRAKIIDSLTKAVDHNATACAEKIQQLLSSNLLHPCIESSSEKSSTTLDINGIIRQQRIKYEGAPKNEDLLSSQESKSTSFLTNPSFQLFLYILLYAIVSFLFSNNK